jgi:DNA-binding NarL/FixJ family response regulator
MLKCKRLHAASGLISLPAPHIRPRIVFSRDDSSGAQVFTGKTARILVVEDDFLISGEMEAELTAAGFEVVGVATSANKAVQLAMETAPHLIIMDIRLDGSRDGIDAATEIFKVRGIRSLFASAYQNPETRRRAEPSMPLGWLSKPYTMSSLIQAVQKALREIGYLQ